MTAPTRPEAHSDPSRGETVFLAPESSGARRRPIGESSGTSLAPDLQRKATQRMKAVALIFSAAFLAAGWVPVLFMRDAWGRFSHVSGWAFSLGSIVMGILVAIAMSGDRLSWRARVRVGLLFQVAGAYGIAFDMYHMLGHMRLTPELVYALSPSWPAIWMILYAVIVPAPPRRALLAALASATAAPLVIAYEVWGSGQGHLMTPVLFFFGHVFPYLVCALLVYAGARVVYQLGREVTEARELGSYRLIERLGSGGMGEVWKASHRMLARPAAVKFIRADQLASSTAEEAQVMLRRFALEARATASLTSAHTIDLYDFGVTEDGTFYYVMELLDGVDLETLVRRFGPLPPARAVHLLAQVCESLDEAHMRGLIHRDIKPANIYACRNGRRCDFVKVLDFGLVARHRAPDADDTRLTLPQQATGTPAYMAPEVVRGQPVDGRADLYALGGVAYWLLAGRPVFVGESVFDVISQHLNATPEPPSKHAPDLAAELDALVLACLAKSPEQRPADARTLARLLRERAPARWTDEAAEAWWAMNLSDGALVAPVSGAADELRITTSLR